MNTGIESVCCQVKNKVVAKMGTNSQCSTEEADFIAVYTNQAVIETAFHFYLEKEGPVDNEPLNEYDLLEFNTICLVEKFRSICFA